MGVARARKPSMDISIVSFQGLFIVFAYKILLGCNSNVSTDITTENEESYPLP